MSLSVKLSPLALVTAVKCCRCFCSDLLARCFTVIQNDHGRTARYILQRAWRQSVSARRLVSLHLGEQSQQGELTSW